LFLVKDQESRHTPYRVAFRGFFDAVVEPDHLSRMHLVTVRVVAQHERYFFTGVASNSSMISLIAS